MQHTPVTAASEPIRERFEGFSFSSIYDSGMMNSGLVEFSTVAADAVANCNPKRQNHVPRKVPRNDATHSFLVSSAFFANGFNQAGRCAVIMPQANRAASPDRCLMKEASSAGVDASAHFEKMMLAAQQAAASRLYIMPLAEILPRAPSGSPLDNTATMPAITRILPIQDLADNCSFRNKAANGRVNTGMKVVMSTAMLGRKQDMDIKKNVSPSDIPRIPLITRKNSVCCPAGS